LGSGFFRKGLSPTILERGQIAGGIVLKSIRLQGLEALLLPYSQTGGLPLASSRDMDSADLPDDGIIL